MQDFTLLFRQPSYDNSHLAKEEIEVIQKKWQDWMGGIAAQGKMTSHARLDTQGKVLKSGGVITEGPFVEIRERLGGLIIIKAENLEEATTLAHGCPALGLGGSVEIRQILG